MSKEATEAYRQDEGGRLYRVTVSCDSNWADTVWHWVAAVCTTSYEDGAAPSWVDVAAGDAATRWGAHRRGKSASRDHSRGKTAPFPEEDPKNVRMYRAEEL